jgi:hypothetical protein
MLKSLFLRLFLYLYGRLFGGLKKGIKMPQLERFFNPQMRVFDLNIKSLPGARLYFFRAGSTTPKVTYADKQGTIPNTNPVIASPAGIFPPVFLDGLYRVELRSSANIVQPGWPIDNVGQDNPVVPYASWSEIITYAEFERVTDPLTGIAYRSKIDNNLGNIPASSPSEWEVVIDPTPSSFTSNADWASWADDDGKISLNVNEALLSETVESQIGSSITLALGGDFGSGSVSISRIGEIVSFGSIGQLTHASLSSATSAPGVIPFNYRPAQVVNISVLSLITPGALVNISIYPSGVIQATYLDSSFTPVNRVSCPAFCLCYPKI